MPRRYYWITAAVLALDLLTKWIVQTRMQLFEVIEIVEGYLRLTHVRNPGVAFGIFADLQSPWKPYVFAAMAVLAVVVIFLYSRRISPARRLLHVALAVTMGGILGNFLDRLRHGSVVDFVEFHIHDSFYWPTFNVADSAISVGICLLLIDTLFHPEGAKS